MLSTNKYQLTAIALLVASLIQSLTVPINGEHLQTSRPRAPRKRSEADETTTLMHEREFVSPQVQVQMDCQQDRTSLRVNFTRPFNGILGAGNLATTKCKLFGAGERYYELHVLHNATQECDARWDNATSSISNTLFIRFHQSLETGSDIAKNILCRLAVGNLIVGRRPTPLKKSPRSARASSPIVRAQ